MCSFIKHQFEEWKKYVPKRDIPFTLSSYVCEEHFQPEFIERAWIHKGPDGKIVQIAKEKPTLKDSAVPSIFPNCPDHYTKNVNKRKPPTDRQSIQPAKKTRIYRERTPQWEDVNETPNTTSNPLPADDVEMAECDPPSTQDMQAHSPQKNAKNLQESSSTQNQPSPVKKTTCFNIHDKASHLKLPPRWGVVQEGDTTIFCHLNELRFADTCVEFKGQSQKPNVFFRQKLVSIQNSLCNSENNLEQYLIKVHKHKLCPGIADGKHAEKCKQFLEEFSSASGRCKVSRALRCIVCRQEREALLKSQKRKMLNEKSRPKMSPLARVSQQKRRLKKKVTNLPQII